MFAGPTSPARTTAQTIRPLPVSTTAAAATIAMAVVTRRRILRPRASRRRTSTISIAYAACSFFESLRRCLLVRAGVGVCSPPDRRGGADFCVDGITRSLGNVSVSSLVESHDLTQDGPHDRDRDRRRRQQTVRALPRAP